MELEEACEDLSFQDQSYTKENDASACSLTSEWKMIAKVDDKVYKQENWTINQCKTLIACWHHDKARVPFLSANQFFWFRGNIPLYRVNRCRHWSNWVKYPNLRNTRTWRHFLTLSIRYLTVGFWIQVFPTFLPKAIHSYDAPTGTSLRTFYSP